MDSWKKAAVLGSIGAAAILFMKKRYPAGVLATGVGLAMLASEYPEKFETVRRSLPDYFDRGMRVMEMASRAGKRITESAGRSAVGLSRSGVQGGVHTTFTVQLLTPGNCSTRDFTCALMLTCSGHPWAVKVISTVTSCLACSGFSAGAGAKFTW
jgi:hypothetical protein